jgi:hypothetical protein
MSKLVFASALFLALASPALAHGGRGGGGNMGGFHGGGFHGGFHGGFRDGRRGFDGGRRSIGPGYGWDCLPWQATLGICSWWAD